MSLFRSYAIHGLRHCCCVLLPDDAQDDAGEREVAVLYRSLATAKQATHVCLTSVSVHSTDVVCLHQVLLSPVFPHFPVASLVNISSNNSTKKEQILLNIQDVDACRSDRMQGLQVPAAVVVVVEKVSES